MTVALNIDGDNPNQIIEFQIESVTYFFHVYWNTRSGWYVSIYDSDNNPATNEEVTPILAGLKCMPNGLLTWRYTRETGLFSGDLLVLDMIGDGEDQVLRDNFGEDRQYVLTYFTEQELEDFQVGEFTSYRR